MIFVLKVLGLLGMGVLLNEAFKRYVPIVGLKCAELDPILYDERYTVVDVRNFLVAHQYPVDNSINIPLAYLHRNTRQLEGKSILIVAEDRVEVKLSARILKKKGIHVYGYNLRTNQEEVHAYRGKQFLPC